MRHSKRMDNLVEPVAIRPRKSETNAKCLLEKTPKALYDINFDLVRSAHSLTLPLTPSRLLLEMVSRS